MTATVADTVLSVRDAVVEFRAPGGIVRALDGVSLDVRRGETLAVVGESGCGKTTLARVVLGLQPLVAGHVSLVEGAEKSKLAERVGMVWQDPFASLDPKWTIGRSVREPAAIARRDIDLDETLLLCGLEPRYADRYPHQLSGGQRQRAAIARALALRPPLVICDEPTAALDMSIQAQILNLLKEIQAAAGCAFLYISHDLLTVRFLADRIAVMYLGRIVEEGPTEAIFEDPRHPYTRALMDSAPRLDRLGEISAPLAGEIPDPTSRFSGCRFAGRCPLAQPDCLSTDPLLVTHGDRSWACIHPIVKD